jgi:hypothetical protein
MNIRQKIAAILLAVSCCLAMAGCADQSVYTLTLVTGEIHRYPAGEVIPGDLLITDGTLVLEAGSTLDGNLYILGGTAQVAGEIHGNALLIFGELQLEATSLVTGDVNYGSGAYLQAPGATILGEVNNETFLPAAEPARSGPRGSLGLFLPGALLLSFLAYVFIRYRPQLVRRVQAVFLHHSLVAGAVGMLGWVVLPTLLLMMIFTFVLFPVALLLGMLMALIVLFGWIALGTSVGDWLSARLPRALTSQTAAALGTFLTLSLLYLVNLIQPLGSLLTIILATVSLGAMLLTRFGLVTFSPPDDPVPTEEFTA